ncbi:MAG: TAXI family TRAP transporter solute-binding subunit [Campylobacterales bacterium]|nr:TAXI family TRAP transporter solute-binding subunit [Campylobacterales bacterium]
MKKLTKNSLYIWVSASLTFAIVSYLLLSYTSQFIKPLPEKKITIATGREDGNYYKLALEYKKLLEKEKVEVTIIPTAGSIEALKLLENKKADIAFYQNGVLEGTEPKNIFSLATIYFEPIWLFYHKSSINPTYLSDLRGKKISIGEEGSGTKIVASKLLELNAVDRNNTTLKTLSNDAATKALIGGEIDASFIITSPNSPIVKAMLTNSNIALMHFRRAKAYNKTLSYISDSKLYEGTINLHQNLPSRDITLLATTASLIVNDSLENELIRLFMKEIKKIHSKASILEEANTFPSDRFLELPIHPEAKRYLKSGDTWLEKLFPFWIAHNIDRLKILILPLLTLLIPLLKGFLPIYRWSIRVKIYHWYDDISEIEFKITENLTLDEINQLLQEATKLQKEIQAATKVPLAYMGEYYHLQMHLTMIIERLEKMVQTLSQTIKKHN